jgi:hypothetical protein
MVGKARVVQTHQVQDRRVQIVDVDLVLNGVPPEVIGGPMHDAALHRPSQPHREAEG